MRASLAVGLAAFVPGCISMPYAAGLAAAENATMARPAPGASDVYLDAAQTPAVSLTDHLLAMCTSENGFALGASGEKDQGLCTGELAAEFATAFARGAELYRVRLEVEQVKVEIAAAQRELWTARREVKALDVSLNSVFSPADRRAMLKTARAGREADEARLTTELARLQARLAAAEATERSRRAMLAPEPSAISTEATPAPAALTPTSY